MPPRSPSRDRADRHAGDRQYFHRPTGVERWKWRLAAVAVVLAGGWAAAGFLRPASGYRYSHGPLTSPHAAWDQNCEACHKPASDTGVSLAGLFRADRRWLDLTCEQCHKGPPHYRGQDVTVAGAGGCASCHHDHQGRDHSLVRLSDAHCTNCHADLGAHAGTGRVAGAVSSFATHPNFRTPEEKAGKAHARGLKFSHAVHMTAGMTYPGGGNTFTAEDLKRTAPDDWRRYVAAGVGPKGEVKLECVSCHRFDGGNPAGATVATVLPRSAGDYFLPINYDLHCKACHPTAAPCRTFNGSVLPPVAVPHRVQPDQLSRALEGEYARLLLDRDTRLKALVPVPGERFDPRPTPEGKAFAGQLREVVAGAVADLLPNSPRPDGPGEGCLKCHDLDRGAGRIAATNIPTVWFPAATFNHAAHKATACAACHPGTGPAASAPAGPLVEKEPPHFGASIVADCRTCHAAAGTEDGHPVGGVRHGCTDCHRYHNGDHPLQGRGAPARAPAEPRASFADFLRGR